MKRTERDILRAFERIGGEGATLTRRSKHFQLEGTLYGVHVRYMFAGSPGDSRHGLRNAIADIKRAARQAAAPVGAA